MVVLFTSWAIVLGSHIVCFFCLSMLVQWLIYIYLYLFIYLFIYKNIPMRFPWLLLYTPHSFLPTRHWNTGRVSWRNASMIRRRPCRSTGRRLKMYFLLVKSLNSYEKTGRKKNYGKMGKLMENQWTHWKPVENLWKIHWKLGMNKNIEKWSLPICILNWQVLFKWWDSGWRSGSYNVGPPHLCFCFCESLLQL